MIKEFVGEDDGGLVQESGRAERHVGHRERASVSCWVLMVVSGRAKQEEFVWDEAMVQLVGQTQACKVPSVLKGSEL